MFSLIEVYWILVMSIVVVFLASFCGVLGILKAIYFHFRKEEEDTYLPIGVAKDDDTSENDDEFSEEEGYESSAVQDEEDE